MVLFGPYFMPFSPLKLKATRTFESYYPGKNFLFVDYVIVKH